MQNNTKKEHESHSGNFNAMKHIRDLQSEIKANTFDCSVAPPASLKRLIVLIIFDFSEEIKLHCITLCLGSAILPRHKSKSVNRDPGALIATGAFEVVAHRQFVKTADSNCAGNAKSQHLGGGASALA